MTNRFNYEDLSIIDNLNEIYNNNLRSIQIFTNSINELTNINLQIHNTITEILNNRNNRLNIINNREIIGTNINRNTTERNRTSTNTTARNTTSSNTTSSNTTERNNLGRVILNNIPYIIESVQQYRIPSESQTQQRRNNNFSNILQRFFQPIEIFPTQTQIEAATRNVRYYDILNPINRSCPISLENFSDNDNVTVIRHCGHIFNRHQLITWFRSNSRCPVCRYDIRNYNSNSNNFFDLSGNELIDTSNNLFEQQYNNSHESIHQDEAERSLEEPLNNNLNNNLNNILNENDTYFDLFFSDNSLLTNFSNLSNVTDANSLVNLLTSLQRRSNT